MDDDVTVLTEGVSTFFAAILSEREADQTLNEIRADFEEAFAIFEVGELRGRLN